MWMNDDSKQQRSLDDYSDIDSLNSGEEIPIWVRGEQKWVSGITEDTTCQDVVQVLIREEENRGKYMGSADIYQITERWRGVEQSLEPYARILDIWNAWGAAQTEVKISLRRLKSDRPTSRRTRCRSDISVHSDNTKHMWKTIHPKRLNAMQTNEKTPSSTEELLKLVLAQGEIIKRQLKKLRHSEHQIGFLEDKTHRARVRKHGSNYLLETYLKGLSEALEPQNCENIATDKNSDSGVMTEADSEQGHTKQTQLTEISFERCSPSSDVFNQEIKDDDCSSTISETAVREQVELLENIVKLNKNLLKEEENLVRLQTNMKKYDKEKTTLTNDDSHDTKMVQNLTKLRSDMAKSACEMQHNEVVLEETVEMLESRRVFLENLHRELANEDREYEMLQTLLFSNINHTNIVKQQKCNDSLYHNTKELLDTLV